MGKSRSNSKLPVLLPNGDPFQGELGEKGDPVSPMTAWLRTNEKGATGADEYLENCQRNPFAYALQRQGYDVEALPTFTGDTLTKRYGGWKNVFEDPNAVLSVSGRTWRDDLRNINKQMREWGEGAIAMVAVRWKSSGGHIFTVERINGKNVFMDTQLAHIEGVIYDDVFNDRDFVGSAQQALNTTARGTAIRQAAMGMDIDIVNRMSDTRRTDSHGNSGTLLARIDNAKFNMDVLKKMVNVRGSGKK